MKKFGQIANWFVVVVAAVFCVATVMLAVSYQKAPLDMTQTSPEHIEDYRIYRLHGAMPVGYYAESEDDNEIYAMVMCPTVTGEKLLASFTVSCDTPLFEKMDAFMNDDTQFVGDMEFSCYAYLSGNISDSSQQEYYDEMLQDVQPMLEEAGVRLVVSNLEMEFLCDINEDYKEVSNLNSIVYAVLAAVCLIVAVLNLVKIFRKPKDPQAPGADQPVEQESQEHHYYSDMEDPADLTNRRR